MLAKELTEQLEKHPLDKKITFSEGWYEAGNYDTPQPKDVGEFVEWVKFHNSIKDRVLIEDGSCNVCKKIELHDKVSHLDVEIY